MSMTRWLKLVLVPLWNGVYWSSVGFSEWLAALAAGRWERCNCCGRLGLMVLRPRSIPPKLVVYWKLTPRETRALVRKETLVCGSCGSKLRARRLASVILDSFPTNPPSKSLQEWAIRPEIRPLRVAEINLIEGVHEVLAALPLLHSSDYSECPSESIPSEDLTRLSYEEESFDLVLTSETLEHVPDLSRALAEIHRVLKPGGLHLFTIPVRPLLTATFSRREINGEGMVVDHATPVSHPGGDWGYPVFTEFGADVLEVVDREGFTTSIRFGPLTEDDLAQVYVSRKC